MKYLSDGDRVTLIKSVLFSLPTYFLSLFKAPASVVKEFERLQRDFLWGKCDGAFKHSLVNWKSVCASIELGGTGIKNLHLQNEALLGKWFWRFSQDKNSLWRKVISIKFGEELGGWCSFNSYNSVGSSIWKGIRKNWSNFARCISWKAGRGDRILFWKHDWLNVGCLAGLFPEIFDLATNKDAFVKDYCSGMGSNCSWSVLLRRNLNDWELSDYLSLMELLSSAHLDDSEDSIVWNVPKEKSFTVRSFYLSLKGDTKGVFPWAKLWKIAVPPRVLFFSWCAVRGKILTLDNLKRRGYYIVNRCALCLNQEESIAHLLLHCSWTAELWSLILVCFGVHSCPPWNVCDFLLAWWGQPLGKHKKSIWNMIPICVFWLIWKERNRRIFEDESRPLVRFKSHFLSCLYGWVKEGREIDLSSFLAFLDQMG